MTGNPEEPFGAPSWASPEPLDDVVTPDITARYAGSGGGAGPVGLDVDPDVPPDVDPHGDADGRPDVRAPDVDADADVDFGVDAPRRAGTEAGRGPVGDPRAGGDVVAPGASGDDVPEPGDDVDAPGAVGPDEPTPPLERILEAILLVVDEPVGEGQLAQVTEQPRVRVTAALESLASDYAAAGRGFELRNVAGGWRLYTAADCAAYVERFVLEGQQARLTQAALETLAVVAYRQPVSRQAIAAIRGVNVDGVIRTLLTRGLVAEVGEDPSSGAHLYGTTPYFLERLGVASLDDLPQLAPLLPTSLDDIDAS